MKKLAAAVAIGAVGLVGCGSPSNHHHHNDVHHVVVHPAPHQTVTHHVIVHPAKPRATHKIKSRVKTTKRH